MYNCHIKYHRNANGVLFYCRYINCNLSFSKYTKLKCHIFRQHKTVNQEYKIQISRCNAKDCLFVSDDKKELSKHIYLQIRSGLPLKCPFASRCKQETIFCNVQNIKQHFCRNDFNSVNRLTSSKNFSQFTVVNKNRSEFSDDSPVVKTNEVNDYEDTSNFALKLISSLSLSLEAKYFLSNSSLQATIDATNRDLNTLIYK